MKKADHLIQRIVTVMLFALFVATNAAAQQTGIDITGNVVDDNGEAIIGASVVVKGNSSYGTVTDFDGNFKLKVPSQSSTIVISFIGMNPSEVKVGSKRQFKVKLTEDVTQLQDVVVVGYGLQKKVSATLDRLLRVTFPASSPLSGASWQPRHLLGNIGEEELRYRLLFLQGTACRFVGHLQGPSY